LRQTMRWLACGLLALGVLVPVQSAGAETLLEDGNKLIVGDATITVDSCSQIAFCGGELQIAAALGPNVGFVIESATNPATAFLPSTDDLTVKFEIATTTQNITSIGLSATGTPNASVGESIMDSTQFCTLNSGSPTVSVGSSVSISLSRYGVCNSSTEQEVFVTKDINANAGSVISVTQDIDAVGAPEPVSSSVLVVGLLGLAAIRRRAR
jgi:hypothetical protein